MSDFYNCSQQDLAVYLGSRIPSHFTKPYIVIEGCAGVGKSTLLNTLNKENYILMPEFGDHFNEIGRKIINPDYPKNAIELDQNQKYFAFLEIEYWNSRNGCYSNSAAALLAGEKIILRDKCFFGALAFSIFCYQFFSWGSFESILTAYKNLISSYTIPLPSHMIFLSAPSGILKSRLEKKTRRHPIWSNQTLLLGIENILRDICIKIYQPYELAFIDNSGFCPISDVKKFIKATTKKFQSINKDALIKSFISWSPPLIKATSINEFKELNRSLSVVQGCNTEKIPLQPDLLFPRQIFSANPGAWRQKALQNWMYSKKIPSHCIDLIAYCLFLEEKQHSIPINLKKLLFKIKENRFYTFKTRYDEECKICFNLLKKNKSTILYNLIESWKLHLLEFVDAYCNQQGITITIKSFFECNCLQKLKINYKKSFIDLPILSYALLRVINTRRKIAMGNEALILLSKFLHEIPKLQFGEPILGELLIIYIFTTFWTQQSFCDKRWATEVLKILEPIGLFSFNKKQLGILFFNTEKGVSQTFKSSSAYDLICHSGWLFFINKWDLFEYIDFISFCFKNKDNLNLFDLAKGRINI